MNRFYRPPATCQIPNLSGKWEALFGRKTGGSFVEVGAYDGESYSNTSCLADVGWKGLYIEPVREFAEKCRLRHSDNPNVSVLVSAVSDSAGQAEIFVGDTLTTLVKEQVADYERIDWAKGLHRGESRQVPTERLDVILRQTGFEPDFDVLVVDVEGAEAQVMAGFDIEYWRPKVMVLELEDEHPDFRENARITEPVKALRRRIEALGYVDTFRDHINTIYVRSDVASAASPERSDEQYPVPRVSLGMPTFERAELLAKAIASIRAQTFRDFELIISDNHSSDLNVWKVAVAAAADDDRIQIVRQPRNIGPSDNFRFVFAEARADLFLWAADDDIWRPTFLEEGVRALDERPELGGWMTHLEVINSRDRVMREIPNLARFSSTWLKPLDLAKYIFEPEVLGKANVFNLLYRRKNLASILPMFDSLHDVWGADMVFAYAFLCRNKIAVSPVPLFFKRHNTDAESFEIDNPHRFIYAEVDAAAYLGAYRDVAKGTPYHLWTKLLTSLRYRYERFYKRFVMGPLPEDLPVLMSELTKAQPIAQTKPEALTKEPPSDKSWQKSFYDEFRADHYIRHTLRRQEHLASLGLPIAKRSVLELGAGIGDHTTFFIDRDCPLCVTDGRPELYEILRDRFSWMRTAQIDLDEEPDFSDPYEIVYAYGLLYHLNDPERALKTMSRLCSGMLLLETCVSPKTDLSINLVKEDDLPSQARSGTGCRPSRRWVFETLKTLFPYVYVTRTQPWHPEFPLDWRGLEHGKGLTRSVFVASREPLDLPTLLTELPDVQVRH